MSDFVRSKISASETSHPNRVLAAVERTKPTGPCLCRSTLGGWESKFCSVSCWPILKTVEHSEPQALTEHYVIFRYG